MDEEAEYEVEKIVHSFKEHGNQVYIVKWKGYDSKHNTKEPEEHLLRNKLLLAFWRSKKNKTQLTRVTKLQEVALAEAAHRSTRLTKELDVNIEQPIGSAAAAQAADTNSQPRFGRPVSSPCAAAYDRAHAALARASCLIFETETSGPSGCVLDMGWILADHRGLELTSYGKLWKLPPGERIHSRAFQTHKISAQMLAHDGVDPKLELAEFGSMPLLLPH